MKYANKTQTKVLQLFRDCDMTHVLVGMVIYAFHFHFDDDDEIFDGVCINQASLRHCSAHL